MCVCVGSGVYVCQCGKGCVCVSVYVCQCGKGCVCVCGKGVCMCVSVGRGVYVCVGRGVYVCMERGVYVWGGGGVVGWGASFLLQMGLNPGSLDPVPSASAAAQRRPNTTRQHGVNGGSVTPVRCERWFSHTSSV